MADPYTRKLIASDFYYSKGEIRGRLIVILDGKLENRGLNLISPISRAFKQGDIIELIGTDDAEAGPGKTVDNIAYIGFVEMLNGGVVLTGDEVKCGDKVLGRVVGYDDTHLPNHQNVILYDSERISGKNRGLNVGREVRIEGFNRT
jgi:hypothetical protein